MQPRSSQRLAQHASAVLGSLGSLPLWAAFMLTVLVIAGVVQVYMANY